MTTRAALSLADLLALEKRGLDPLVDVDGVAALLGLTRKGVYQLVQDRRIPHLRLGGGERGRLRFRLSEVRQWLEESRVPSREERP